MTVREFLQKLNDETFLAKAAITTASGGQLSPEDADKFIDTVVEENDFFDKHAEIVKMTASTKNIDIIGIASRVLRKATEGVAPTETVGVNIERRSLETVEVILPYDVSYSFLEENIEGKDVDDLLNKMFAKQFGNDLLDLGCNGDSSSADDFLKIDDGWIEIIKNDANVHEFVGNAGNKTDYKGHVFPGLISSLPNKWKRNLNALAIYVSPTVEEAYRSELADRATALGDQMLTEKRIARYKGIDVVPVAYFPDDFFLLTIRQNLKVGVGRQISYERQPQPRKRIIEYTITAKIDFNYAISDAIAYAYTGDWS